MLGVSAVLGRGVLGRGVLGRRRLGGGAWGAGAGEPMMKVGAGLKNDDPGWGK